jgi:magnesium-protoporphyrin IX monomethyl ester (oxidative) cyclase
MKVLLIHTYITSDSKEFIQTLSEPLGLISLATNIKKQFEEEVDLGILDLYADGYNYVKDRGEGRITRGISEESKIINLIQESNPDIIGIHCNFTGYANDALEVARIAKKALPNSVLVMGGAHASYDSENILKDFQFIDYIVRGEGEITFCELIKAVISGNNINNIDGITYRDNDGKVLMTPTRGLVEEIDTIGKPDRRYIDMKKYMYLNSKSFPLAMKYPVATIMASRGCPYNCIFCSTKNMWGRRWRGRSPNSIICEIEELIASYGIKEIVFYDDQFLVDKKWVVNICDLIIEKKLNISLSLPAGISVWIADKELLIKMKKAGFYRLNLPIESGNLNSLKFIRKPVKLKSVLEIIKCASRLGFWTSANFIIGFPYETKDEINETIDFAYKCGIDYPFFFIARPFPGSEMYDIYKSKGLLKNKLETSSSVFVAKGDTLYFTAEELTHMRSDAEKNFLKFKLFWCLKPRNFINYILPKISSLSGIIYVLKIMRLFLLGKHKR